MLWSPNTFRWAGVHYDTAIGVEAKERVFLDRSGGLARRFPMRQMLTSWTSLYGAMRRHFPAEHYHQGAELTDFEQSAERVEARFADGREKNDKPGSPRVRLPAPG